MEEDKTPNGTFTQIPNVFLDTCDLPETAQILFLRLLRYLGHTGGTFTGSVRKLANLTHLSKSTVDRMAKRLHASHLINLEYRASDERQQEVMIVTLNTTSLWNTNRYHCKIEPVPMWDKELPNRDTVSQDGTTQPTLGHDVPSVSVESTQEDSKTILNTNKTLEDDALVLTPDQQSFEKLYYSSENRHVKNKILPEESSLEVRKIRQAHYEKLSSITTIERLNSLYDFAKTDLPPVNNGKVYLGNLVYSYGTWIASLEQEKYEVTPPTANTLSEWTSKIAEKYEENRIRTRKRLVSYIDAMDEMEVDQYHVLQEVLEQAGTIEEFFKYLDTLLERSDTRELVAV